MHLLSSIIFLASSSGILPLSWEIKRDAVSGTKTSCKKSTGFLGDTKSYVNKLLIKKIFERTSLIIVNPFEP